MFVIILLIFLFAICVAVLFFTLYWRWSRWGRLLTMIPGTKELPVIGHAWTLGRMDSETSFNLLRQWAKQFGRIYKFKMGWIAAVNIFHPDDIEVVYSTTSHNEKQQPYNLLRPWLCEGLLVSNGEKWKQRRKMLTPAFHFNILKRFCMSFNEHSERLLRRVEREVGKERTDIRPLVTGATLNIMCETSMGITVNDGEDPNIKEYFTSLSKVGDMVLVRYFTLLFHIDWIFRLFNSKKEDDIIGDLHKFTEKIIAQRKEFRKNHKVDKFDETTDVYTGKKRLAMLDMLLENERENKIDIKGVREEVDTFLFEGHDTTAAALSFMIMRIANEPQIQDKIHEELMQIFGDSDRAPSPSDLNELKYLECCIKESLRIYPSVFFMARYATKDVILGGYTVPPGTIIHVHVYDLHHDPRIYPDPMRFDPGRFSPEETLRRHPYAYIPFSAGPRNCIGQKFAMLEMKTIMSGLLRRFVLEPVTRPEEVVLVNDLILRSKDPLYVRIRSRCSTKNNQSF